MIERIQAMTGTLIFLAALGVSDAGADVLGAYPPMFLVQAEYAVESGDAAGAVALLQKRYKRLRAPADRIRGYAVLCRAYLQQDKLQRASAFCVRATRMDEATWSDFNNRGVVELRLGKLEQALVSFERAGSLNPQSQPVKSNIIRARALLDQGLLTSSSR